MSSKKSNDDVQTLEHGDIYFFYRPQVEEDDPEKRSDLQRLYLILSPNEEKRYRLIEMGQKHLPESGRSRKNRQWGFVNTVRKSPKAIREVLSEES